MWPQPKEFLSEAPQWPTGGIQRSAARVQFHSMASPGTKKLIWLSGQPVHAVFGFPFRKRVHVLLRMAFDIYEQIIKSFYKATSPILFSL